MIEMILGCVDDSYSGQIQFVTKKFGTFGLKVMVHWKMALHSSFVLDGMIFKKSERPFLHHTFGTKMVESCFKYEIHITFLKCPKLFARSHTCFSLGQIYEIRQFLQRGRLLSS